MRDSLQAQVTLSVLAGFAGICVLSRMTMAESALGGYAREQLLRALRRILRESDTQAQVSRQDADPLVALLHNAEASANLRVAKRLAEETGLTSAVKMDFMDALAELGCDQETLVRALTEQLQQ